MKRIASVALLLVLLGFTAPAGAQSDVSAASGYLSPPQTIVDILDASPTPTVIVGPTRDVAALVEQRSMPPIGWLARPMHRLAGYRIDPRNSGPWRAPETAAIAIVQLDAGNGPPGAGREHARVVAPRGTTLGWPRFSPDGSHLSYAVLRDTGIELWVLDLSTGQPRPLTSASLNATWGNPCEWLADNSGVPLPLPDVGARGAAGAAAAAVRPERAGAYRHAGPGPDLPGPAERPARRGAVRVPLHEPDRDRGAGHRVADRHRRAGTVCARLGCAGQPAPARRAHRAAVLVAPPGEPFRPLRGGLDARGRRGRRGEAAAGRHRADRRRRHRPAGPPLESDRSGHAGLERGAGRWGPAGGRVPS